jgi:hypothetical protein
MIHVVCQSHHSLVTPIMAKAKGFGSHLYSRSSIAGQRLPLCALQSG